MFGEDSWTCQFPKNVMFKAYLSPEQEVTMQDNRGNAIFRRFSIFRLIFHTNSQSKMLTTGKKG